MPDVLVTQYGGVSLFLNRGAGRFDDITEAAGLKNLPWGTSAAFFDYDRDGWLDLVIVNYVDNDPSLACKDRATVHATIATRTIFPARAPPVPQSSVPGKPAAFGFEDVTRGTA